MAAAVSGWSAGLLHERQPQHQLCLFSGCRQHRTWLRLGICVSLEIVRGCVQCVTLKEKSRSRHSRGSGEGLFSRTVQNNVHFFGTDPFDLTADKQLWKNGTDAFDLTADKQSWYNGTGGFDLTADKQLWHNGTDAFDLTAAQMPLTEQQTNSYGTMALVALT